MKEFLTKNFLGIIIIILGVLLYFQRCNEKVVIPEPKIETKTEYITQPPVYIPQYIPMPSSNQPPIIIPPNYIPSQDANKLLEQYKELVNKFLAIKTYKDSIELLDSSGAIVGKVNLEDIISENEIKLRKPSYQLKFPHTTTTITKYASPKNQFYIGGKVLGNQDKLISGASAGIYLKNRKDQLYGIEAQKQIGVPVTYGIGMYWKIKLKK